MGNTKSELEFEGERLKQTISLAEIQLNQAKLDYEERKSDIIFAKQELRENTQHAISGLWSSDGFEALVELSQYANPVTSKIESYETIGNKIIKLEKMIKSPYFARVDFKFEDDDFFEKVYIGRASLMKENPYEVVIYDWRSPIASLFYRFVIGKAFYEAPSGIISGEINLKRQHEIKEGVLEYFFDADVQIIDEFLRKLLSQNTSNKMKAIVETIQKEQDVVIRDMENDLMMVQGVAGSGKTSIALHRAAYLMYQGLSSKLSANNIIIISPNSLFEQYISSVLPELGESNVETIVFEELLSEILGNKRVQSRNQFLEELITKDKCRKIMKSSIEFKASKEFAEILGLFISDLPHKWIEFVDVYYGGKLVIDKKTLRNKILSGRKTTPLKARLEQLEEYIIETIQQEKGSRLSKGENAAIRSETQKFTKLNVQELYRNFVNNKEYFYALAKENQLPENIEEILTFTQENLCSGVLYYDDATAMAFLSLKLNGTNEYKNIKQVVIDEAQDYYILHYEIFNLLFPNSQYTVLGDINQTLEKQEDLSLYEEIKIVLNKKRASLVTMDKSFRCTNEILEYSSKFIDNTCEIKSFNRKGDEPEIHAAKDLSAYCQMIVSEINTCLEKGYGSVGLVCKTEKNAKALHERLKDKTDIELIKNESKTDLQGVFIIPVYMSKGLEFDAVLICDADRENYHSEDDKKLLYIASTRALHRLSLLCYGEVSPLL